MSNKACIDASYDILDIHLKKMRNHIQRKLDNEMMYYLSVRRAVDDIKSGKQNIPNHDILLIYNAMLKKGYKI